MQWCGGAEQQIRAKTQQGNGTAAGAVLPFSAAADKSALLSDKLHTDLKPAADPAATNTAAAALADDAAKTAAAAVAEAGETAKAVEAAAKAAETAKAADAAVAQAVEAAKVADAAKVAAVAAAAAAKAAATAAAAGAAAAAGEVEGGTGGCLPTNWTGNPADYKLTKCAFSELFHYIP